MKLFASFALVSALALGVPAMSQAQVRVQVEFGSGPRYYPTYGYYRYHGGWFPRYSHYGSYPGRVVVVRRYRPAPVVVIAPSYRRHYRHW